jgi:WD40 repeat protein
MPGLHPPTLNAVTAIRGGFAGVRQSVWERTGLGSLPIFNPSVKRAIEIKVEKTEEPPISSYLSTTDSIPQVNYKHLYLSRRIISNRIRKEEVRPMIVDAITSIESGGLSGHTEAIYSLSLFRHPLIFNIGTPKPTYSFLQDSERAGTLEVGGRDWLLSGSRDKTLRLWSLDTPKPKVVKVFMGGHDASVLSAFVVKLSSSGNGTSIEKMVAISGGSDGKICRWDIEGDGRAEKQIMAHTGSVLCVKGDQERIVSCSKGQSFSALHISR